MQLQPNNLHLRFIEQLIGKTIQTDAYIDYSQAQIEWDKLHHLQGPLTINIEDYIEKIPPRDKFFENLKICPCLIKITGMYYDSDLQNIWFYFFTNLGRVRLHFDTIQSLINTGEASEYGIYKYKLLEW